MSAKGNAPVIIKRKKVVSGDGHHGGAWKVAYADFVTAMMAFFLLMWLLNATTEKQRKGLADYFNPTIPINRISGGGDGAFGGTDIFSEQVLARNGTGASLRAPMVERQVRGDSGTDRGGDDLRAAAEAAEAEDAALREIDDILSGRGGESMVRPELMRHIVTRVTDEGLIIELFDTADATLFDGDGDTPTPLLRALSGILAELFSLTPNAVAVGGHVRGHLLLLSGRSAWELSSDRADAMRRLLVADGLGAARVRRVTGHADRRPAARNPMAVRNNRLEIVLLRSAP